MVFFSRKRSKRWSSLEICTFRQDMHQQLRDTYWDHAGNQTVCQSAMDQLPNLHVSKKADEAWILAYVESIREVYSHASGNLPELLFTDAQREEERKRYWLELSKMFSKVLWRITEMPDAHHPFSPIGRMACMMAYASLYSVYKTVAIECNNLSTVYLAAKRLNEMEQSEYSTVNEMERNQLKMLFENIDLINILSLELPKKYDLLPPPRRRSSADEHRVKIETPLSAHLRDFPKSFIDDLPKVVEKKVEEIYEELPPLPPAITVEDLYTEPALTSAESHFERQTSRYGTIEEYADEISTEAVTTALQQIVEERNSLRSIRASVEEADEIAKEATELLLMVEEKRHNLRSIRASVEDAEEIAKEAVATELQQMVEEKRNNLRSVGGPVAVAEEISKEAVATALQQMVEETKAALKPIEFVSFVPAPKIEEKPEAIEEPPLQLTPFDPASCFKEQDKIERYGRRGLFDSPLPVIGRKLPIVPLIHRQHSSPSESKDQPKVVEPAPSLLSPTFNQKVENKIIQAVLNEKPVSPMFPPPIFVLDEFDMHKERF